jgi:hypothetical protein
VFRAVADGNDPQSNFDDWFEAPKPRERHSIRNLKRNSDPVKRNE